MNRDLLDQLRHIVRPHATRLANMLSRAVVNLVDDGKKLQLVQLGALFGETVDSAEHFQPYGFTSVPLVGAEGVVVFPNGDRSHPLLIAVSDRRSRPTGGAPGQVTMYHHGGAKVTMLENGNIEVQPGPGGQVIVSDGAGGEEPVVTQSQFMNHTHLTAGTGAPVPPSAISPTPALTGTTVLQTK